MGYRHRTRQGNTITGSYRSGLTTATRTVKTLSERVTDYNGVDGGSNPFFDSTKSWWTGGVYNGWNGQTDKYLWKEYISCPVYPMVSPPPMFHVQAVSSISIEELATMAAKRSNPARTHVDLPVFIFELRDLPRMIKLAGDTLLQKISSANLSWQFGWAPLLSDLRKLVTFQDHVERRARELASLMRKGGLRRRLSLPSFQAEKAGTSTVTMEPYFSGWTATYKDVTVGKVWAVCRWKPTGSLPKTDGERRALARRLIFGLTAGQITQQLWEALPWSWLIDWFSNVGDYLIASNNSIAYLPDGVWVMQTVKTKRTYIQSGKPSWLRGDALGSRTVSKLRSRGYPTLSASVPFLSGRQWSILGSLAILRSRIL